MAVILITARRRRSPCFSSNFQLKITMKDVQQKLLIACAKEMLEAIVENPNCLHVRTHAFEAFINGRIVQLHVLVTQDESDFLEHFQTEVVEPFRE